LRTQVSARFYEKSSLTRALLVGCFEPEGQRPSGWPFSPILLTGSVHRGRAKRLVPRSTTGWKAIAFPLSRAIASGKGARFIRRPPHRRMQRQRIGPHRSGCAGATGRRFRYGSAPWARRIGASRVVGVVEPAVDFGIPVVRAESYVTWSTESRCPAGSLNQAIARGPDSPLKMPRSSVLMPGRS
jgi:hypothetical protein